MQKLTHFETQQVANTAAYVALEHEYLHVLQKSKINWHPRKDINIIVYFCQGASGQVQVRRREAHLQEMPEPLL